MATKQKCIFYKSTLFFIIIFLTLCHFDFAQKKFIKQNDEASTSREAAYGLIKRILPNDVQHFRIEVIPKIKDKDVFEIESRDGYIILKGSDGVSVASALNYYLKKFAHCQISWNGNNLNIPHPLPIVPGKIQKISPYKYRYYFNYCTFNYTASWWDWQRWQKEIDFMALNGINMPLALVGQNAIWQQVYKSMGFTEKDLESFFSGPAYFSWFWMGNLDGYGGPLPESWIKSHEELQKKILKREREFGMTPVLPSFTGHVPPAFKEKFPQTKLIKTHWVGGFNDVYSIDPTDTMFTYIGKKFMTEQIKVYGTNHLYSSDTFNENRPPTNDSTFLNNIGKKVYLSMADVDPKAVWVMQGWLFYNQSDFWQPTQIKALLSSVPDDKMIILDLWSEVNPVWNRTEAYYGKPWIWCMLHNFGGRIDMFGNMKEIAEGPSQALHSSKAGKMVGIGITAEGIEQNPAVYELMLDNVWRDDPTDLSNWLKQYTFSRYGKQNVMAEKAWKILLQTVYDTNASQGRESTITERPTFDMKTNVTFETLPPPYNAKDLLPAWSDLISSADELKNSGGFQYDLVDVSRQVLADYGDYLYQKFSEAYEQQNLNSFRKYSRRYISLIDDLDKLLATRKDFLLGRWLDAAKGWATDKQEKILYEKNARDLITLWGDKDSRLYDYAQKQWSGLLKGFYKKRWVLFLNYVINDMKLKKKINQKIISEKLKNLEWKWVNGHESYPTDPAGNSILTSQKMYRKYYKVIKAAYSTSGMKAE